MSGDTFDIVQGNRETITGTLHDPAATPGDVLTVQPDGSIAAKPGGGAGGIQVVTVPVSSAEILDLVSTPALIVPGTPGFVTVCVGAFIVYERGTVSYVDHGGSLIIVTPLVASGGGYHAWTPARLMANFLDLASSQGSAMPISGAAAQESFLPDWDGEDVQLIAAAADVTDGDGTLLVTLSYFLAPTA